MLETNEKFCAQILATGPGDFAAAVQSETFPRDEITAIRKIFVQSGLLSGPLGMLELSGALGEAVPELVRIARRVPALSGEDARRSFVISAVVALFRMADAGATGGGGRAQAAASGGPGLAMYPSAAEMEAQFVRPLASGAYDATRRRMGG